MDEQLRIILIIIVSVSIFGLILFVFVKNYIKSKIDHLVKIYGIDSSRLTAVSEGSNNGIALSDASRANRRVDFLFAK